MLRNAINDKITNKVHEFVEGAKTKFNELMQSPEGLLRAVLSRKVLSRIELNNIVSNTALDLPDSSSITQQDFYQALQDIDNNYIINEVSDPTSSDPTKKKLIIKQKDNPSTKRHFGLNAVTLQRFFASLNDYGIS